MRRRDRRGVPVVNEWEIRSGAGAARTRAGSAATNGGGP